MTMPEEYRSKKEEYMDNRSPSEIMQDEEDALNEKFEAEVEKAYDILWNLMSPDSIVYNPGYCKYGQGNEQKLLRMIRAIDTELGR